MKSVVIEYRPITGASKDKGPYVHPAPAPKKRSNRCALTIAQEELGRAFDRDTMTLRGRPVRLNELMLEVNELRVARGDTQILYNPLWEYRS